MRKVSHIILQVAPVTIDLIASQYGQRQLTARTEWKYTCWPCCFHAFFPQRKGCRYHSEEECSLEEPRSIQGGQGSQSRCHSQHWEKKLKTLQPTAESTAEEEQLRNTSEMRKKKKFSCPSVYICDAGQESPYVITVRTKVIQMYNSFHSNVNYMGLRTGYFSRETIKLVQILTQVKMNTQQKSKFRAMCCFYPATQLNSNTTSHFSLSLSHFSKKKGKKIQQKELEG